MELCINIFLRYINLGLILGAEIGVLLLLRPLLCRICTPQQRVVLWAVVWVSAYLPWGYDLANQLNLLPATLRTLLVTRTSDFGSYAGELPAILPGEYQSPGFYHLALPGGRLVPVSLSDGVMTALMVLWAAVALGLAWWCARRSERLERQAHEGRLLSREDPLRRGIPELERETTMIRVCKNLPTSFVRRGHDTGRKDGIRDVICLQKELPPERMRLVLLHELEHIRLKHTAYKGTLVVGVTMFFWWNPILWLACRLTCRDMELACDDAVLAKLEPAERRDYARTLVELGSGRHLWGSVTSFGECDAALRVRRAARWKPAREEAVAFSLLLASVLFVFFFCGGPVYDSWEQVPDQWPEYLESGAWIDQVAQKLEQPGWQPQEVWSKTPEALVVLDREGQWYSFSFVGWTWEDYNWVNASPMKQAYLEGYTRVS